MKAVADQTRATVVRRCHDPLHPAEFETSPASAYDDFRLRGGALTHRAGAVLRSCYDDLLVSKQRLRQSESVRLVRLKREDRMQNLGFSSRPFVLCGLPVKRPTAGTLVHERRNGSFLLQVLGHRSYGLPWGQDRLVPIFLSTLATRQKSPRVTFPSAAEMLDTFGLQQGRSQNRRLVAAVERIFGATIFFGIDSQLSKAAVFHQSRFSFMQEARIWCSRHERQCALPAVGENVIVLSDEFYREISTHPIPTDFNAVRAWSSSPAALNLFTWLSYHCFVAKGDERVPLFGEFGLARQLGIGEYNRPRKFRERLEEWILLVKLMWPECPTRISADGHTLIVGHGTAIAQRSDAAAC